MSLYVSVHQSTNFCLSLAIYIYARVRVRVFIPSIYSRTEPSRNKLSHGRVATVSYIHACIHKCSRVYDIYECVHIGLDETSHNVGFSTTAQYTSDSSSTTTPIAPTPTTLAEPVLKTKKVLKKKKKKQKNQGLFGGLRGGFFNSKPKKKKSKESTKPSPKPTSTSAPTKPSGQDMATAAADGSIPFIRARKPSGGKTGINNITSSSDNPYMIPEVQSAMKDSLVNGAKEWVNKDLMTKITG